MLRSDGAPDYLSLEAIDISPLWGGARRKIDSASKRRFKIEFAIDDNIFSGVTYRAFLVNTNVSHGLTKALTLVWSSIRQQPQPIKF